MYPHFTGILVWSALIILLIRLFWFRQFTNTTKGQLGSILAGGLIFGLTGLFLGVGGAILLAPGNNLAPIIGIVLTGPIGFVTGLFAGAYYWKIRITNRQNKSR